MNKPISSYPEYEFSSPPNPTIRADKKREKMDAVRTYPRWIRLSQHKWGAVNWGEERLKMMPGAFVCEAAARIAVEDGGFTDARLTPEVFDLFRRVLRGVHLQAHPNLDGSETLGRIETSEKVSGDAISIQDETLGLANGVMESRKSDAGELRSSPSAVCPNLLGVALSGSTAGV